MPDFLDILAKSAQQTINEGYYTRSEQVTRQSLSLQQAILNCAQIPIISEIKAASPSQGTIRENLDLKMIAREMVQGGAVGISILTEPKHFNGKLNSIFEVRKHVEIPILMKDIILCSDQIEAAHKIGADAVLLIHALFDREYATESLLSMIELAHKKGLEVLLEVHTETEFLSALKTKADMIGINNRDLRSLQVNLESSKQILSKHRPEARVIVSESGIHDPQDLLVLRECGVHAFLIGTALMKSKNLTLQLRKFVNAK